MNPDEMLAAVIVRPGGTDVLEVRKVSVPVPQASEVRVRVHASALNRADILQRQALEPSCGRRASASWDLWVAEPMLNTWLFTSAR
jgi:NADPH:quinone reductase-like Zn-dependent oxidoreductase